MSRLVTFGCSFTYGHGLSDCLLENNLPGKFPSNFAWPTHLSKLMDKELLNLSEPGISNQTILKYILTTEFLPEDTVVILWTHHSRDTILFDKEMKGSILDKFGIFNLPIGNWMIDHPGYHRDLQEIAKNFYLAHSDYDLLVKKFVTIHHAEQYLTNLNLRNFHFLVDYSNDNEQIPEYIKFKNLMPLELFKIMFNDYPLAGDNSHPGPDAHIVMAKEIFKSIKY